METTATPAAPFAAKGRLLVVDDEENHAWMVRHAFERRGYGVKCASCAAQALLLAGGWRPDYALVDLRISDDSGLALIPELKRKNRDLRIVILTGYASVATAVEAIKLGALHYLAKPVDADAIEAAFRREAGDGSVPLASQPLSLDRLAWEHIHAVLAEHAGNISAAARVLGMHRRTLQRKLGKFPARH
jgi:two-component system response regulator RegA